MFVGLKPPSKYSYLRIIHQLVIIVLCTNLANYRAHPVRQLLQLAQAPRTDGFWEGESMGEPSPQTRVMIRMQKLLALQLFFNIRLILLTIFNQGF